MTVSAGCRLCTRRTACQHGIARGESVVNEEYDPSRQVREGAVLPEEPVAGQELRTHRRRQPPDLRRREPEVCHQQLIQEQIAFQGKGAEAGLGVAGDRDLPDDEEIEGEAEAFGDDEPHRDAAGRYGEHDGVSAPIPGKEVCQAFPRLLPVGEHRFPVTQLNVFDDLSRHGYPT